MINTAISIEGHDHLIKELEGKARFYRLLYATYKDLPTMRKITVNLPLALALWTIVVVMNRQQDQGELYLLLSVIWMLMSWAHEIRAYFHEAIADIHYQMLKLQLSTDKKFVEQVIRKLKLPEPTNRIVN